MMKHWWSIFWWNIDKVNHLMMKKIAIDTEQEETWVCLKNRNT